jgi:plasmid stabilization system protein ParE
MGNQIILAPEAEQDLDEIVAYIAKDNPAAAEKFGIRLIERVELLKSFPRLGRVVRGRRGERVLVEGSILIFYRFGCGRPPLKGSS